MVIALIANVIYLVDGANHVYSNYEEEVANIIAKWVNAKFQSYRK